jgi:hypothetical protein
MASFLAVGLPFVIAGLFVVPYLAARALWLVPMPTAVRVAFLLAVPGLFIWWLGTNPDFHDITSPGAVLFLVAVIAGWLCGAGARCRRRLLDCFG